MTWIKPTAFTTLLFASLFLITSCKKDAASKKVTFYSRTGIVLSGTLNVPASASTATGSMDVTFDEASKLITYKVTWSGLTGNPTGFSVYGLAPAGFPAGIVQAISISGLKTSGNYSGTLFVDGVYIKEEDVLNGLYYIGFRTAAYPAGEIRGQIVFQ